MAKTVVVVGASIGGFYVVNELVKNDFDGKIILIDKKSTYPYNPYPLSKEWMRDLAKDIPPLLKKKSFYKDNNIELLLDSEVVSFDDNNKTVTLANNKEFNYDYLVLATGSKLRYLDVENGSADGIFYLREFKDALAIKNYAKNINEVMIVGAGFIALELAASLTMLDKKVKVILRGNDPLIKALGSDASAYIKKLHQKAGVKFVEECEVAKFIVNDDNQVVDLVDKDDQVHNTEMVIVGIGVVPNISVANPNLNMDKTIVVNEYNETNIKDVYALGDVVIWPYSDELIHLEHWENAYNQALSVAKNIIERNSHKLDFTPYFWSDQYDETFEYLGYTKEYTDTVVRGDINSGKFSIVYLDEANIPQAMLFANKMYKRGQVTKFLNNKKPINKTKFADESIDLLAV